MEGYRRKKYNKKKNLQVGKYIWAHPDIRKLKERLGFRYSSMAALTVIQLWGEAFALEMDNGVLIGINDEYIERAVDWEGEPGAYVAALLECDWLSINEFGYYVLRKIDYDTLENSIQEETL